MELLEAIADRLTANCAVRGMVAGCRPGQEQTRPPKGGGRMRMLGGDSTGEATGSAAADRVRNVLSYVEVAD